MTTATGSRVSRHAACFYDTADDLAARVAPYLVDALVAGGSAVVIATPAHARAIRRAIADDAIDDRELTVLDAEATLRHLLVDGAPDAAAFDAVVGTVIREIAARTGRVAAYGEMVDVLWRRGDVTAAIALETLWNELQATSTFDLLCAYRRVAVEGHAQLRDVCALHTDVDPPGAARHHGSQTFDASPLAAREARRFVRNLLVDLGHADLVDDAALVVGELAANAVVHARSRFTVDVSTRDGRVRIDVRDESSSDPRRRAVDETSTSGRGLYILDALTHCWAIARHDDGKVVWAELAL